MPEPRESLYKVRRDFDGKVYDVWAEKTFQRSDDDAGPVLLILITNPTDHGDEWIQKKYTTVIGNA